MNPDTDDTYQQSIYLVLTNVLSTSFLMFHITLMKSAQHCPYNYGIAKGRYTRHMWSNDMFIHTLELHLCYFL